MRRLLPALLLSACFGSTPSTPEPAAAPAADVRDTLVVASPADLRTAHPLFATGVIDQIAAELLYLPMFSIGFHCALTYQPATAASWTWEDEGRTLRVALRTDVRWSDGQPLTADDVVFAWQRNADPAWGSQRATSARFLQGGAPVADGPHTVVYRFTHAYDTTTMLAHASLPALPRHALQDLDPTAFAAIAPEQAVVSGPWKIGERVVGERFTFVPNDQFTGPDAWKPQLARVVVRVIPVAATQLAELEAGNLDLVENLAIPDLDRLAAHHPEVKVVSRGARRLESIAWNPKHIALADPAVRRALSAALDRPGLILAHYTDRDGKAWAQPAASPITPELCTARHPTLKAPDYNPGLAGEALDALGWRDSDGDGVRDKAGVKLAFRLAFSGDNDRQRLTVTSVTEQLRRIGVEVAPQPLPTAAWQSERDSRTFDAIYVTFQSGLYVDPSAMWSCETPERPRRLNITGYCNPEVDAAITAGLQQPDAALAAPHWLAVQERIAADAPMAFLWWSSDPIAVHRRFQPAAIDLISTLHDLHTWRVPPDQVLRR